MIGTVEHKLRKLLLVAGLDLGAADRFIHDLELTGLRVEPPSPEITPEDQKIQDADDGRWFCPHCKAYKPELLVHLTGAVLQGIGNLAWVVFACTKCRAVIGLSSVGYQPSPDAVAMLKAGAGKGRPS